MKIITVCGSLKFRDEIMKITEELTLHGNCVLSIVYPTKNTYSDEEKKLFGAMHRERIKLSDAVFAADIDNYIGGSTQREIEFAKALNKEIIYYSKWDKIQEVHQ